MISKLRIENLILIDLCELSLGQGLNILTGETGSGKSVLLTALQLVAGERADLDWIGKKQETATVEATVSGHQIRREIHRSGKNRCFVDDKPVTLSFLKQFLGSSIDFVDQNSAQTLFSQEEQLKRLDAFGGLSLEAALYKESLKKETELVTTLSSLQGKKQDLSWAEEGLASIVDAKWKLGEEEHLSQEHDRLSHQQETLLALEESSSFLDTLNFKPACQLLETAARFDTTVRPFADTLKNISLELVELSRSLCSASTRMDTDPSRLAELENRIAQFEQLKKRFGDIEKKRLFFQQQIDEQEKLGSQTSTLTSELEEIREKNETTHQVLTAKRKKAATTFAAKVSLELKGLNLPDSEFLIDPETFQYLFSANKGSPPAPLSQCASGGELSRLLFALQVVLAASFGATTLIFDEIDSNIGGHTATTLGTKLRAIGEHRQLICVTHFAQVARFATHHFSVTKRNATIQVHSLTCPQREKEYQRMAGINS